MHAIYFGWKVAPGREPDFEYAWLALSELIRDGRLAHLRAVRRRDSSLGSPRNTQNEH